jgi:hypothetical protein
VNSIWGRLHEAWPHGRDGPPANNVQVIITSDGQRSLAIYELKFSLTAINGITALCDVLIVYGRINVKVKALATCAITGEGDAGPDGSR